MKAGSVLLAPRPRKREINTDLVVFYNVTQTINIDATHTIIVAGLTLVYSCSCVSVQYLQLRICHGRMVDIREIAPLLSRLARL
jgi:hypothetical protein